MTQTATPITGGVPTPPFAFLPDPARIFAARASRCRALAPGHPASAYLSFLATLMDAQAELAGRLGPAQPPAHDRMAQLRGMGMPPIDRTALLDEPESEGALKGYLDLLRDAHLPPAAAQARDAVVAATPAERRDLRAAVLEDRVPTDAIAAYILAAAAAQVDLARRAAALGPEALEPVATGICPACGGRPAASVVTAGLETLEGSRYACCAACSSRWNEVRVKCLSCGSMKSMSYRGLEEAGDAPANDRTARASEPAIKAECCNECGTWLKVFYQLRLPGVEPIADDVASLGLDLRMADSRWRRAGANPFLAGY
ncbi:formate dehydrogenase accessory protein FdhE [Paracoccus suum]|uniref:Formate dehydrogenase accessory protein FdhE n=1 Tax=Paracoccus suum TaxID=2259340 RepID=A0A344PNU4_9RHOB|nr:formate dehydrogenase accessory protein FdhE [Paracoccus suum]AXC51049.1 formate dehydrogenase accessory protein FdhE [Paracoccus suum]